MCRLWQPGGGGRLPARLRADQGQGPGHEARTRGEKGRAAGGAQGRRARHLWDDNTTRILPGTST